MPETTPELIHYWHGDKEYLSTPQDLISELTYANYKYNRQRSPHITPAQWQVVFGEATTRMEARYQRESHPSDTPEAR